MRIKYIRGINENKDKVFNNDDQMLIDLSGLLRREILSLDDLTDNEAGFAHFALLIWLERNSK